MGVHMAFLWTLFSGEWSTRIHGPIDFFTKMVIGTDLWIPLLLLFVVRGLAILFHALKPELIQQLERSLNLPISPNPAAEDMGTIVGVFYGRIIVMHMTIIFSAFLSIIFGSISSADHHGRAQDRRGRRHASDVRFRQPEEDVANALGIVLTLIRASRGSGQACGCGAAGRSRRSAMN